MKEPHSCSFEVCLNCVHSIQCFSEDSMINAGRDYEVMSDDDMSHISFGWCW